MTTEQMSALSILIDTSLNNAEKIWDEVSVHLFEALSKAGALSRSYPSSIPGYPQLEPGQPMVDDFIAMVVDMRDSTRHLLEAISAKRARVSQMERVFFETSALLPALSQTIGCYDGKVLEYLGDGVLAIFRVNNREPSSAIYASYDAAKDCIDSTRRLVSSCLAKRYSLPEIDIGVGLARSKAIVTLVGLGSDLHPKVIGECVYRATKLSAGRNQIHIDEHLYLSWPKTKDGWLAFRPQEHLPFKSYVVDDSKKSK